MVKEGDDAIDLTKTQLYRVWIERDEPQSIDDAGTPQTAAKDRWFFAGPAHVVADQHYKGFPPHEEDLIEGIDGDP